MNFKLLTATAVLTAAIASPAVANGPHHGRSATAQHRHHQARVYQYSPNYSYGSYGPYYGSGFWPADVAAGIVGGAIGTAGAIATAPFRYNGYYGPYAAYNGACAPGTTFIGSDGLRHVCR